MRHRIELPQGTYMYTLRLFPLAEAEINTRSFSTLLRHRREFAQYDDTRAGKVFNATPFL